MEYTRGMKAFQVEYENKIETLKVTFDLVVQTPQ